MKKSGEDLRDTIMAPLDHMFDNHNICGSKWCFKKCAEEDNIILVNEKNERSNIGYRMFKVKDKEFYKKLYKQYE